MAQTKIVKLYSLDSEKYPDTEVEVEIIEDTAAQLDEFTDKEVVSAIKCARVNAHPATVGECVDTRPRVIFDGKTYTFSETEQTISQEKVDAGAMVVKNPDGEEYVIKSKEAFDKKYRASGDKFRAVDGIKPFRRANKNVAIQTSWGEEQIVLAGSMICVADQNDIYSVSNAAFQGTYTIDPFDIKMVTSALNPHKKEECVGE